MPGVARGGDDCTTGHGCDLVTTLDESKASPDVYANGRRVERMTDPTVVHLLPSGPGCAPHTAPITGGSGSVFVNGLRIARLTDPVDAGGKIISASTDVFAGG